MDLDNQKVKAIIETIKPILINEYRSWVDDPKKNNRQIIEDRLYRILDQKKVLVNHLSVSPTFELFFSFSPDGFYNKSYSISLYGDYGDSLQVTCKMVNNYGR
mgnify:CR=1 FL=1